MSETNTEENLIARLQAGDKTACAECIDRYGPGLFRLALRLMENEADAEEVLQETFLSAYRAIDSFQGRSGLATWLYRIAYNAAMMRLRKPAPSTVSIDEKLEPDGPITVPSQLFDWCCLPERDFETNEVREFLETNIREMPETLQTTFVLRELEGLSTNETAAVLNISNAATKKRLHRARLWLRERLTAYFAGEENRRQLTPGS